MFPSPELVVPLVIGPRSMINTFNPAFVKASAVHAPTIPAPITMTSEVVVLTTL